VIGKTRLLLVAVALLLFASPAMASAGTITAKAGTLATVGSSLSGTSLNMHITSSIGDIVCKDAPFVNSIEKNTALVGFETKQNASSEPTECFFKGTIATQPTSFNIEKLVSTASETGKGTASLSMSFDLPSLLCTYTATAVPFTYVVKSNQITFTKGALKASPAGCGTATLDADFTFTIGGTAVILD
jgi:hypothetical protein